jgi:hypothetical protein
MYKSHVSSFSSSPHPPCQVWVLVKDAERLEPDALAVAAEHLVGLIARGEARAAALAAASRADTPVPAAANGTDDVSEERVPWHRANGGSRKVWDAGHASCDDVLLRHDNTKRSSTSEGDSDAGSGDEEFEEEGTGGLGLGSEVEGVCWWVLVGATRHAAKVCAAAAQLREERLALAEALVTQAAATVAGMALGPGSGVSRDLVREAEWEAPLAQAVSSGGRMRAASPDTVVRRAKMMFGDLAGVAAGDRQAAADDAGKMKPKQASAAGHGEFGQTGDSSGNQHSTSKGWLDDDGVASEQQNATHQHARLEAAEGVSMHTSRHLCLLAGFRAVAEAHEAWVSALEVADIGVVPLQVGKARLYCAALCCFGAPGQHHHHHQTHMNMPEDSLVGKWPGFAH